MSCGDYSSPSESENDDEIRQIKHAMRVARSRQTALKQELGESHRHEEQIARCHLQRCKQQADEIVQLKLQLVSRDDEIQFLQRKLSEKDKSLKESGQLSKLKNTAAISSLWEALKGLEQRVNDRKLVIAEECAGLARLVSGLEQHAMGGHHMVSSRTAIGLFIKMRESIAEIKAVVGEDGDAAAKLSKLSHSVDVTKSGADKGGGLKDVIAERTGRPEGKISAAGKGKRSADAAYLDLCRYLEEENGRLQRAVEGGQEELERSRADAAAAALIPQYRLAIVRARSQAGQLQNQLIQEQNANQWLRGQLDQAHKELQTQLMAAPPPTEGPPSPAGRGKKAGRCKHGGKTRTAARKDGRREPHIAQHRPYYREDAKPASSQSSSPYIRPRSGRRSCSLSASSDAYDGLSGEGGEETLLGREREVETDLQALDDEIELLKDRLEQAALSHTQRVVSQVMHSATGSILSSS